MKPRVLLRADAGASIGFGHFVRTVALAAYLAEDFDCLVATRNPDSGLPSDYQRKLAADNGIRLLEIAGKTRGEFDPAFAECVRQDDIVVLDNYYFETEYQRTIRQRCKALVCIDDMHDRHFVADAVMTFCPLRRDDFSLEPHTRFFGGMEWSFLRSAFLAPACSRPAVPALPRRVALAMGGADPYRLTGKMVRLLRGIRPELEIDVLAGQTVAIDFDTDERLRVHRQATAEEIAALFDACDLGIFPASTVCVEAFSRRLPVAAGHYVDNQEELYEHGVVHGWFAPLGCLLDPEEEIARRLKPVLGSAPAAAPDFRFNERRGEIIGIFKELNA